MIRFYHYVKKKLSAELCGHTDAVTSISAFQYDAHHAALLSSSHDGSVRIWSLDMATGGECLKAFSINSKVTYAAVPSTNPTTTSLTKTSKANDIISEGIHCARFEYKGGINGSVATAGADGRIEIIGKVFKL